MKWFRRSFGGADRTGAAAMAEQVHRLLAEHGLEAFDRQLRLASLSGTSPAASYQSDADGQLTARPGQTMAWDHLGRLTSVTTASGATTYTYG